MRRARKQQQREQARAAAAREHQNEADGEDNGSPVAGPSRSPSSASRSTKRKIRSATEPNLQVPRIPSLDDGGPSMPEDFGRIARQQQQLEISRRVSMDDYALQHGLMDRRGSGESGDGDTQGDDLADEPGPSTQRILGPPATMPSGPMGSTEQPLGLHGTHGATTTSPPPLVSSGQLPPMSMEPQTQSMQFWQHQQPSSVAAQHQAPISPTTVVAPHVSHLPGPGPAVAGMGLHASSSHHRGQTSWPPSGGYGGSSTSQQVAQQSGLPPLVPATSYSSHHSNPLPFPLQPGISTSQQTQSPPSHLQPQSQPHLQHSIGVPTPSPPRTAPQTQAQHFQAHSQQQYSASTPPPATSPMHRLHQGSMLLTPLNPGQSHRQPYAQESAGTTSTQPSAYGQATIGGAAGASSSAQGLPSVFELENPSRDQTQEQRGSFQQQQQPGSVVQQSAATSWESYQGSSSYPAAGPAHRPSESYAQPPALGRAVGYDPSRDYYPSTSRPDMYGGQRNVVYGAAVPQSRPEAHPAAGAAYAHPQRSVSYSAPSSDPYMVPGPSQRGGEPSYIPARSESYSGVPSRGDPGAAYASAPGGGRSDPYGAQRPAEQPQQQYQTIPPPQGHIPSHPHHPGLHPQHLPSSDPAHPDPRHDPYGRGHPGPSEGPY